MLVVVVVVVCVVDDGDDDGDDDDEDDDAGVYLTAGKALPPITVICPLFSSVHIFTYTVWGSIWPAIFGIFPPVVNVK